MIGRKPAGARWWWRVVFAALAGLALLPGCRPDANPIPPAPPARPAATAPAATSAPPAAGNPACGYGVIVSGRQVARPEVVRVTRDLGARWVRLNCQLDGADQDYTLFLDAGINVFLALCNQDPANARPEYGSPRDWPNAGFPFRDAAAYQARLRALLAPAVPYLAAGREVWVQCENEAGDAQANPRSRYWRGTTGDYLRQWTAFRAAVRSVSDSIPVVLTSFTSEGLDAALDPADPRHEYAAARMEKLLAEVDYDAVDLHFYGCASSIPAKARWVRERLRPGARWITTECGGPDERCPSTPAAALATPEAFERRQAEEVPLRLRACADQGASICLWFSLFDLRQETSVFSRLGLIDQGARPPRRKPAFAAFQEFVAGPGAGRADR